MGRGRTVVLALAQTAQAQQRSKRPVKARARSRRLLALAPVSSRRVQLIAPLAPVSSPTTRCRRGANCGAARAAPYAMCRCASPPPPAALPGSALPPCLSPAAGSGQSRATRRPLRRPRLRHSSRPPPQPAARLSAVEAARTAQASALRILAI